MKWTERETQPWRKRERSNVTKSMTVCECVMPCVFHNELVIQPNKKKTHMVPANNKTCSKRKTKPSSPASLHLTKDIFDVIQNNVYLPSAYHSFVYELSLYAALIGVCVIVSGSAPQGREETAANEK